MANNLIQNKSFDFALSIIELYKKLKEKNEFVISKQLLRCETSIGANIEEGLFGQSRADFVHKLSISLKEAGETRYWLKLLEKSKLTDIDLTNYLDNINEIINILTNILKTSKENNDF